MEENLIPFNHPCIAGKEFENIAQAIANGHAAGDGPFTRKCQALLESALGCDKVLLTTSCTHALEIAAILLDIQPGDEFITPSFTFVSTVNAFVLRGGQPVFVDIREDTLNIDEEQIEAAITPRTKAIVVVHYAGVACEMDKILEIGRKYSLPVIEDNAHGLFGTYKGRHLGTFGSLATLSFHETKNFNCGEGGALLINDPGLIERAEIIREKGTDRSKFLRGEVDKYTWTDIGSSYVISDLLAAYLYAQLEARTEIHAKRLSIWNRYYDELCEFAARFQFGLPTVPSGCNHPGHLFYLLASSLDERDALIAYLKSKKIHSVFHYVPLHSSPMGLKLGSKTGDCPVTADISERLLRLPFYNSLEESDQMRVVTAIEEFYSRK